eukprot:3138860-Amphidinium_carterae.1
MPAEKSIVTLQILHSSTSLRCEHTSLELFRRGPQTTPGSSMIGTQVSYQGFPVDWMGARHSTTVVDASSGSNGRLVQA